MFGRHSAAQPKDENISGCNMRHCNRSEMPGCRAEQRLARHDLSPIASVGRWYFRFAIHHLSINAAHKPEAISPHPLHAGLMVIGRSNPCARCGDDARGAILPKFELHEWRGSRG